MGYFCYLCGRIEDIMTNLFQCLDTVEDAPEQLPALEARLNALVYQGYGLDEADIAVIEGYLGGEKATMENIFEELEASDES
jgi:hypothetical protein